MSQSTHAAPDLIRGRSDYRYEVPDRVRDSAVDGTSS